MRFIQFGLNHILTVKLTLWAAVSMLLILTSAVRAHEISPAIVDLSIRETQIEISAEVNLEAILAGIDQSAILNTDGADNERKYNTLRSKDNVELRDEFQQSWDGIREDLYLTINGEAHPLTLTNVEVAQIDNLELARLSTITLSAELPNGAQELTFGWAKELGVMVLRVGEDGEGGFAGYVDPGQISPVISVSDWVPKTGWQTFIEFIPVGFDHILPKGLDHILFVVGLFLLSPRLRPLVWQISTFTLAHTVTLALGALSIVTIAPEIVEPLIALSIVYVAVENIVTQRMAPWRVGLIFAFGLLHGLGFATVLAEFGMPSNGFIPALIGFNIGVELGQLTVVALCLLAFGYWLRDKTWYRSRVSIPMSIVVAGVGLYWAFERIFL